MATNKRLIKSNDEGGGGASFNTVTYTGNATARSITGVGFQPDFVWIKNRDAVQHHNLIDSVRGNTKLLYSSLTNAEATTTNHITSFDSDGFSLGTATSANGNGNGIVAWCWKAGGAAVTNTDGTITSQVYANTEAGFSIVSYTGNSTNGATVGHGLGVEPSMVIFKNRSITSNWAVYSKQVGVDYTLFLNSTDAKISVSGKFSGTNSSVIGLNSAGDVNSNSMIAYCFAEVAGFSKFGSYTGNGLPLGPSIDLGFEPAFVMVKQSDFTNSWLIYDNKRNPTNSRDKRIFANISAGEFTDANQAIDFNPTGFQIIGTDSGHNRLNGNFIYMAFANQF